VAKQRNSDRTTARRSAKKTRRDKRRTAARIVPDVFVVPNKPANRRVRAPAVGLHTRTGCKITLKRPCPIQLVFEGKDAHLRVCVDDEVGNAVTVPVKSPVDALAKARDICGCMEAGGNAKSCAPHSIDRSVRGR